MRYKDQSYHCPSTQCHIIHDVIGRPEASAFDIPDLFKIPVGFQVKDLSLKY
jgi:hypothetical protein